MANIRRICVLTPVFSATDASRSWDYAYDANGNRTSLTDARGTTTYSYVAGSNQLDSLSGVHTRTYQYDADGNVVNDGRHRYQYDARNRLVGVDARVRFALNGLGQRVEKRSRLGETLFVYGLNGELIARANPMGRTQRDYIYVNGAPAAVIVYPSFGGFFQRGLGGFGGRGFGLPARSRGGPRGELYYIHTDHLGTPRVITSSRTGTVVWRWDGEPFGASRPDEDPGRSRSRFVFNLRFPGQYYDAETGLDYNYFRDYDPRTGRYVESDPIGMRGGQNPYSYVFGSPILANDPYGLLPQYWAEHQIYGPCWQPTDASRRRAGEAGAKMFTMLGRIAGTVATVARKYFPPVVSDATAISAIGFTAGKIVGGMNKYAIPRDPDNDNDGIPDAVDTDDDNDCIPDKSDPNPYVWTPSQQSEQCCKSRCGSS